MSKWCVRRNDRGVAVEAGYHVVGVPEEDQYIDPQKDILDDLHTEKRRVRRAIPLLGIDASTLTGDLKIVVEYLQAKHG